MLSTKLFVFWGGGFLREKRLGISCDLSASQILPLKCQALFSLENTKNKIFCLLQLIVISTKGTDRDVIVFLVSALVCESCFVNPFMLILLLLNMTCPVLANSVDPDQFASETDLDLHCLSLNSYVNFYQKPGSSNLIDWKLEVGMAY